MSKTVIVVPCYNEEKRLLPEDFSLLLKNEKIQLLFVDDGSGDETHKILLNIQQNNIDQVGILNFSTNRGKSEAVRNGMLLALDKGANIVGYLDADLSTPVEEMERLVNIFISSKANVLLASRVRLLGHFVFRSEIRHYLGRIFATLASFVLGLNVYDTQCGAKLFRDTPVLRSSLHLPFHSRWAFDVELIGRLIYPLTCIPALTPNDFLEVPLNVWKDIPGSNLKLPAMIRAAFDLLLIAKSIKKRQRQ